MQAAFEDVFNCHFQHSESQHFFRFTNAHGMGFFYEEPIVGAPFPQPYAVQRQAEAPNPLLASPGMVFQFHPNFFIPGRGAAVIGDMILVVESGCELLTSFPRKLLVA